MITPIEGYVVICDKCGEKRIYYDNPNERSVVDIDIDFRSFLDGLRDEGWIVEEDKVLCPKCAETGDVDD